MPRSTDNDHRLPRSPGGIPSVDEIWEWQNQHVELGTKYTGSVGHSRFIDWLSEHFSAIPELTLKRDRLTSNRWVARDYSLSITTSHQDHPRAVPVTYYYPYSGRTAEAGVTGKLVDLGTYPPIAADSSVPDSILGFWTPARGAVALVRAGPSTFSLEQSQIATGGFEPGKSSAEAAADYEAYAARLTNPTWQGIFHAIRLLDAKNAGVLAVVCLWTGMPDDEVVNQYNPFTTSYPSTYDSPTPDDQGCPAL